MGVSLSAVGGELGFGEGGDGRKRRNQEEGKSNYTFHIPALGTARAAAELWSDHRSIKGTLPRYWWDGFGRPTNVPPPSPPLIESALHLTGSTLSFPCFPSHDYDELLRQKEVYSEIVSPFHHRRRSPSSSVAARSRRKLLPTRPLQPR